MSYVPKISGFTDLMIHHSDGSKVYFMNGLVSGFCLEDSLKSKYDITDNEALQSINDAIKANWYMFDVKPTKSFYYPNTNMFSGDNSSRNISGFILTVKSKYTK